jgi:hypothetical protein
MPILKYLVFVCLMVASLTTQAQLPIGTVALYSDGDVEKLVAYEGGFPVWEDTRKRRYTLSGNPLIPLLKRQDLIHPENSYGVSLYAGDPERLLNSEAGQRAKFVLRRTYADGHSRTRDWHCESLGSSRASVVGKTQLVDRYHCKLIKLRKGVFQQVREERTLSYAPQLGLFTRLERKTRSSNRIRKLKHLLLPDEADARTIARLYKRLVR